jgi:hypothetical protein
MSKKLIQAAAGAGEESVYVEDVFSTYLYEGTGSSLSIDNGIDLAGEGGMTWIKIRDGFNAPNGHHLYDTERGATKRLRPDRDNAEVTASTGLTSFNSNGFTVGSNGGVNGGGSGDSYVSWTFRKQAGFFDVVTYTGDGSTSSKTISHSLGSTPGHIILKKTSASQAWYNMAKDGSNYKAMSLNDSGASFGTTAQSNVADSTTFDVGYLQGWGGFGNDSGATYVAYLFAHDDQSFGDNGDESIIKCGSYTGTGSAGLEVDVGFEPQFVLIKRATGGTGNWMLEDVMRGMSHSSAAYLYANLSAEEQVSASSPTISATSTGFSINSTSISYNASSSDYIYIAIRRPMKIPESGTDVFTPNAYTGNGATRVLTSSNDPVDLGIIRPRASTGDWIWSDRLRGATKTLYSNYTQSEATESTYITGFDVQDGIEVGTGTPVNGSSSTYISYMLSRAKGFMDIAATSISFYSASGSHNLGVVPEMIIGKRRDSNSDWYVYHKDLTKNTDGKVNQNLKLNSTVGPQNATGNGYYADLTTTTYGTYWWPSTSGNVVHYFFATLDGVSKVGSYTGTASDLNVDCGFTTGARFILIRRSDAAGFWYVYDSARGIVSGNDPSLYLGSNYSETTTTDYVDPLSSGFTVTSSASGSINVSGGEYIFLAIA